jgi:hypothetical protein
MAYVPSTLHLSAHLVLWAVHRYEHKQLSEPASTVAMLRAASEPANQHECPQNAVVIDQ